MQYSPSPCAALIQTAAGSSSIGISRTGVNAAASPSPAAVPIIPTTTASWNRKTHEMLRKHTCRVRKTVGCARFEGEAVYTALASVYRCLCPLLNYFYPSKKLLSKKRLPNGRVQKIYGKELKTPFQRLREDTEIAKVYKERAIQTKAALKSCYRIILQKPVRSLSILLSKNMVIF
jgi:hypothetical protein